MNPTILWILNRAKEPSTFAGLAGLMVVFGVSNEEWSAICNAVAALACPIVSQQLSAIRRHWPAKIGVSRSHAFEVSVVTW